MTVVVGGTKEDEMEFEITRTSSNKPEKRPCKEAYLKEVTVVDRRNARTLKEARLPKNKHWSDDFFASGTNHREENGLIARDLDTEAKWFIKVDSLEALVELTHTLKSDIIVCLGDPDPTPRLEIYDDYRE